MTVIPISGMTQVAYSAAYLVPVVDMSAPPGLKNVAMTLGEILANATGGGLPGGSIAAGLVYAAPAAGAGPAGFVALSGSYFASAVDNVTIKVVNGSLTATIAAGAQGPVGATGPQGPAGAAGAAGSNASITAMATSSAFTLSDFIGISNGTTDAKVSFSSFLAGATTSVLALAPAGLAASTDGILAIQGSALVTQTVSGLLAFTFKELPTYQRPVLEVTANVVLDSSSHNGRVLVASQPLTVQPAASFSSIGAGFVCDLINLSSGAVSFASGITTLGASSLAINAACRIYGVTYSGGSIILAVMGGTAIAQPLTVTAPAGAAIGGTIAVTGAVSPSGTAVSVALSTSNTAAPTSGYVAATVSGSSFTASLPAPSSAETIYVWAEFTAQPSTNAVSGPCVIAANAVGFTSAPSSVVAGALISVTGTVAPSGTPVQVGTSTSATTAPTAFQAAAVSGGTWSVSSNAPTSAGTYYLWAEQTGNTGVYAVSGAITVSAAPSETITVNTITAPAPSTAFTVSGGYTGGPPTALDYSSDGGSTWTAAASPAISGGTYSFSDPGLSAGTYTIKVRDHTNTSVVGTSNSFTVAAPALATIASQSGVATFSQGVNPYPSSIAHGTTGTQFNIGLSGVVNTSPAATIDAYFTTASPTTQPTTGAMVGMIINNNGFGAWYLSSPSTAGTFYLSLWLTDSNGAVSHCIMTPITVT